MADDQAYFTYVRYLIPLEGVERMKMAAPLPFNSVSVRIWRIVGILEALSDDLNSRDGVDGTKYFELALMDLCSAYESHAGVGTNSVAPKAMGHALRGIGMTMIRRKDGYKVLWTKEQLSILSEYVKEG